MTELLRDDATCAFVCSKCGAKPGFTRCHYWGFNMKDARCETPGCDGGSYQAAPQLACTNLPRCQLGDGMHAQACPRAGYDDARKAKP